MKRATEAFKPDPAIETPSERLSRLLARIEVLHAENAADRWSSFVALLDTVRSRD